MVTLLTTCLKVKHETQSSIKDWSKSEHCVALTTWASTWQISTPAKLVSKLLFRLAEPPTVQHNRWVEYVIMTVVGGFPGKKNRRWKDEEEAGRGG